MGNMHNKSSYNTFIYICLTTFFFWLVAHGYRFMNNLYAGDSLVSVFQDDIYWQRSLGRFMQPFIMIIRGTICSPWLIFIISVAMFSVAMCLIIKVLMVESKVTMTLIIGVLVCNSTWTSASAAYLPWVDVYAVSMLLAVLGGWFILRDKIAGYIGGAICFVACMGFYQAYIDVAFALVFIVSILELADENADLKVLWIKASRRFATLGISGLLYYILFRLVCIIHHVQVASTYNGLSGIGNFSGASPIGLFFGAYKETFKYLFSQGRFASTYLGGVEVSNIWGYILKSCIILILLCIIAALFYVNKGKSNKTVVLLQTVILLLMPFAINFVYFMSKGMEHELMVLSTNFILILPLVLVDKLQKCTEDSRCINIVKRGIAWTCITATALIIWNNIVYSNQIYYKVDMQDKAALSFATRLVDDIDDIEEYVSGKTQVCFIGGVEKNAKAVPYLREVNVYGVDKTPFNYDTFSLKTYINNFLGVNMVIIDDSKSLGDKEKEMRVYPNKGSIIYYGDTIFVKLSD